MKTEVFESYGTITLNSVGLKLKDIYLPYDPECSYVKDFKLFLHDQVLLGTPGTYNLNVIAHCNAAVPVSLVRPITKAELQTLQALDPGAAGATFVELERVKDIASFNLTRMGFLASRFQLYVVTAGSWDGANNGELRYDLIVEYGMPGKWGP
jgi:hypothetical protein